MAGSLHESGAVRRANGLPYKERGVTRHHFKVTCCIHPPTPERWKWTCRQRPSWRCQTRVSSKALEYVEPSGRDRWLIRTYVTTAASPMSRTRGSLMVVRLRPGGPGTSK